ncbi:MAG: hypothetical protein KGZ93_07280 [Actinobacteria bacterium]|nr:hypothetical protein [Actinomycetota bacterium]
MRYQTRLKGFSPEEVGDPLAITVAVVDKIVRKAGDITTLTCRTVA